MKKILIIALFFTLQLAYANRAGDGGNARFAFEFDKELIDD